MSRGARTGQGLSTQYSNLAALRPVAYTPTVTWAGNTITTQSGFYIKTPGMLQVWVSFSETAGSATAAFTITIPAGYTAVTMSGSLTLPVGYVASSQGTFWPIVAASGATSQIGSPINLTGVVATWMVIASIPTLV